MDTSKQQQKNFEASNFSAENKLCFVCGKPKIVAFCISENTQNFSFLDSENTHNCGSLDPEIPTIVAFWIGKKP